MRTVLFFLLLIPFTTFSADCEVDGISDSPQKMNCLVFRGRQLDKLELRCDDGQYKIRWRKKVHSVDYAYHEEVETGSNPLVFVTKGLTLTTVSYRFYSQAEVVLKEKTFKGLCFLD